jgi:hypothetical protein
MNIASTNYNFGFRNLTLYKGSTSFNWILRFNQAGVEAPVVMNWENIRFEGNLATDTIVSALSRESGTVSSFNGTARNVKSICQQWLSAGTGFTNHTNNMIFDDCEMGNRYIAPQGGNRILFAGQMRGCNWNSTQAQNFEVMSGAILHNTRFGMPLNFCNSGARITYCRFVPVALVPSLKGTSATQNVYVAHCELSATGIDATINNTAGANAYNVLSDN